MISVVRRLGGSIGVITRLGGLTRRAGLHCTVRSSGRYLRHERSVGEVVGHELRWLCMCRRGFGHLEVRVVVYYVATSVAAVGSLLAERIFSLGRNVSL